MEPGAWTETTGVLPASRISHLPIGNDQTRTRTPLPQLPAILFVFRQPSATTRCNQGDQISPKRLVKNTFILVPSVLFSAEIGMLFPHADISQTSWYCFGSSWQPNSECFSLSQTSNTPVVVSVTAKRNVSLSNQFYLFLFELHKQKCLLGQLAMLNNLVLKNALGDSSFVLRCVYSVNGVVPPITSSLFHKAGSRIFCSAYSHRHVELSHSL